MNRKGQITIFIIIGIVIVAGVVLFFIIANKTKPSISEPTTSEPEAYIEKCARDAANEAIDKILPQGGYISPSNYKLFEDNKVQYLCYTNLFYNSCVNQEPLYISHLQNEITSYVYPRVDNCFSKLKQDLEQKGYEIDMGGMDLKTEMGTGYVRVFIDRKFTMTKNEEVKRIEKFKTIFNSPIYKLGILAQEIANEEAKFCYFEYVGYMVLYPEFEIVKKNVGSGIEASKIYLVKDRFTGKTLNIAVRSCAIPSAF